MTAATLGVDALSSTQRVGADWLRQLGRAYLADPPGYGKTRQLLAAAVESGAGKATVICPAAIRDAQVWPREAARVGLADFPLDVRSYHQMSKAPILDPGALILDEAHHLKNRKVTWGLPIRATAGFAPVVFEASGTPTPQGHAPELWGQLQMLREMPAYWTWIGEWFDIIPDEYSAYATPGTLRACPPGCPGRDDPERGRIGGDCEHWAAFADANYTGLMLRRPESDLDLPPMVGYDDPLDVPMTAPQKKLYNQLKKEFLAELPAEGVMLEALTDSKKWSMLWQLSTGLSSVTDDPADDRHSGKLALLEQLLAGKATPTVVPVYFRNTGRAVGRMLDRLGVRWLPFSAATSAAGKAEAVDRFQGGELDVLLGSVEMIKEGLTLTAADSTFFVERSWTPDTNLQVARRVLRRGQTKTVSVRQLVAPKSVDSGQWKDLHDKNRKIDRLVTRTEVARLLDGV